MIIFWRRMGWLVPLLAIASGLLTQLAVDAVMGEDYYTSNEWPKIAVGLVGALIIGSLGYYLNVVKRPAHVHPETGVEERDVSHTFFFIPIQYWSLIVLVVFYYVMSSSAERKESNAKYITAPAVNDMYLLDQSNTFTDVDKKYPYAMLKVIAVSDSGVVTLRSAYSYESKVDVKKVRREGGFSGADDFGDTEISFSSEELNQLLESADLYQVFRL